MITIGIVMICITINSGTFYYFEKQVQDISIWDSNSPDDKGWNEGYRSISIGTNTRIISAGKQGDKENFKI